MFFVCCVIRVIQGEFSEGSELAFNTVQPRRVRWRKDKLNVVKLGPRDDLGFGMGFVVVQDDVEPLLSRVAMTKPAKKGEKVLPCFAFRKASKQSPRFQVVSGEKMPYAAMAMVSRP